MTVPKVLRVMQDGIEFFTVAESGECAVSVRGLARMCGVRLQEIQRDLGLDHKTGNKRLECLDGLELFTTTSIVRSGKAIKPIRSQVAVKIVKHCAVSRKKSEALEALAAFAEIGFDSYVQAVTGYLPAQYAESTLEARHQITRLIREPNPWKRLYSAEMCDKIRTWYFPQRFLLAVCLFLDDSGRN
jgi:hypothetical protein